MSERDELAATVDRLQTDRDHLAESHSSTSTDLSDRQSEIHDLCEQVSQSQMLYQITITSAF